MSLLGAERLKARMAIVDEHIRCENRHDLDGLMATFGMDAVTMTSRGGTTAQGATKCGRITASSCARCPIWQLR